NESGGCRLQRHGKYSLGSDSIRFRVRLPTCRLGILLFAGLQIYCAALTTYCDPAESTAAVRTMVRARLVKPNHFLVGGQTPALPTASRHEEGAYLCQPRSQRKPGTVCPQVRIPLRNPGLQRRFARLLYDGTARPALTLRNGVPWQFAFSSPL